MSLSRFEFIAGALSLNYLDTLGNRRAESVERLSSPRNLAHWIQAAQLGASSGAKVTQEDFRWAHVLRDAIDRVVSAAIRGKRLDDADLKILNKTAAQMPLRPQVVQGRLAWDATKPISAVLSMIAADAIELVTSERRLRVRVCPECKMTFLDTSRPGKRRWCSSSAGCGNRAKVRRFRSRRRRNLK